MGFAMVFPPSFSLISNKFCAKISNFIHNSLYTRNFIYLVPAKPRENGMARESAFFELFLESGFAFYNSYPPLQQIQEILDI